jgi:nicotinate phosphoribosyltransferase
MIKLHKHFRGRTIVSPGWGSNLTNDMTNWTHFGPVSIVIKPTSANGRPTVKLSNNVSKATGDKDEVERYKRIFNYTSNYDQAPTY